MAGRLCYLVVKNGFIVHETYRRGHTQSSLHPGFRRVSKSLHLPRQHSSPTRVAAPLWRVVPGAAEK